MIDWTKVDTVLLDMDGTLLDLYFDNFFWMELVPQRLAEVHGKHDDPDKNLREAHQYVNQHSEEIHGTLNWYCTDYWTEHLDLPIIAMKEEINHLIGFRPQAQKFLAWLKDQGKRRVIVTNAHPDTLAVKSKRTGLVSLVDDAISSHDFKEPKESPLFWQHLAQHIHFEPERALLIDDSEPVLRTAHEAGIGHLLCIRQPDSQRPPRDNLAFTAIGHFDEIIFNDDD